MEPAFGLGGIEVSGAQVVVQHEPAWGVTQSAEVDATAQHVIAAIKTQSDGQAVAGLAGVECDGILAVFQAFVLPLHRKVQVDGLRTQQVITQAGAKHVGSTARFERRKFLAKLVVGMRQAALGTQPVAAQWRAVSQRAHHHFFIGPEQPELQLVTHHERAVVLQIGSQAVLPVEAVAMVVQAHLTADRGTGQHLH